ncbi:MAG: hypothetical protein KGI11_01215 [Thaumarchaeota archaeon]|nr:hypothetical protein [Nitrososphaerota archaeon]
MILHNMKNGSSSVDLVWISTNYSSVFFSEKEIKRFIGSFVPKNGVIPMGLNIEFIEMHLNKKYSKKEILSATPDQLKKMTVLP